MNPGDVATNPRWTLLVPVLGVILLVATWGRELGWVPVVIVSLGLGASVLAAVHHAEIVALRVGEPFGTLILAVAVTVIEVALIVTLMSSGGDKAASLARDTVFAAIMITCNGVIGLSLILGTIRHRVQEFHVEGASGALAVLTAMVTLSLAADVHLDHRRPHVLRTAARLRGRGVAGAVRRLRVRPDGPPS